MDGHTATGWLIRRHVRWRPWIRIIERHTLAERQLGSWCDTNAARAIRHAPTRTQPRTYPRARKRFCSSQQTNDQHVNAVVHSFLQCIDADKEPLLARFERREGRWAHDLSGGGKSSSSGSSIRFVRRFDRYLGGLKKNPQHSASPLRSTFFERMATKLPTSL